MMMGWEGAFTRVPTCEAGGLVWRPVRRPARDATWRRCDCGARDSRAQGPGRASASVRVAIGATRRPVARAGAVGVRQRHPAVQQRLQQSDERVGSLRSLDFIRPQLNLGRYHARWPPLVLGVTNVQRLAMWLASSRRMALRSSSTRIDPRSLGSLCACSDLCP